MRKALADVVASSDALRQVAAAESIKTLSIIAGQDNRVFLTRNVIIQQERYGSYTLIGLISL